jgi:hypothetical protein
MATQPEDDELTLDTPAEDPENPVDPQEGPENPEPAPEEGDEEDFFFAGDDLPPEGEADSPVIKQFRQRDREHARRIRELEKQLEERAAPPPIEDPGPEPDFEDVQADWYLDPPAWKAAHKEWEQKKAAAEEAKSADQKRKEAANKSLLDDRDAWHAERAKIRVPDREEATAIIETALGEETWQRAAFAKLGADAAKMEVALARNPARLQEVMSIDDPIKWAFRLGELKGKIQMTKRKAPEPEDIATGTANVRQESADKVLERLEKEAAANGGDRSKIAAHKAAQKKAARR